MYSHLNGGREGARVDAAASDILSSSVNGASENCVTTTFATLDGLTSGIPTRTTPTLTPTMLKNIEESFLELQSIPPAPMEHQHQAGFVPPSVNISGSSLVTQHSTNNTSTYSMIQLKEEDDWMNPCDPCHTMTSVSPHPAVSASNNFSASSTTKSSGRHGGRRPNREERLSPEEEERRRVRRERNKLAAARCRKRRMDHTNSLLIETEGLEDKRQSLQNEILLLKGQKEELEFLLEAHKATCKLLKVRNSAPQRVANGDSTTQVRSMNGSRVMAHLVNTKPAVRPTSLSVSCAFGVSNNAERETMTSCVAEVAGIPITTPSNGIFGFETLMEGGSSLTPVSSGVTTMLSSCAGQQRSSSSDLSSPDTINPPKLVSL